MRILTEFQVFGLGLKPLTLWLFNCFHFFNFHFMNNIFIHQVLNYEGFPSTSLYIYYIPIPAALILYVCFFYEFSLLFVLNYGSFKAHLSLALPNPEHFSHLFSNTCFYSSFCISKLYIAWYFTHFAYLPPYTHFQTHSRDTRFELRPTFEIAMTFSYIFRLYSFLYCSKASQTPILL